VKDNVTLGLIVGNRRFFPAALCEAGRATMLKVLAEEGIRVIALGPQDTLYGSVESLQDAHRCADLFRAHRDEIDGILVTLPNFGDERAVANILRWAELNVPVLVHAFPDTPGRMAASERRDSFCGKLSICNNLYQYGIPFSLTEQHTIDPESPGFRRDLRKFSGVCRVVRGLRGARFGLLGARPAAFNTVRSSEKLLERSGITVETLDLSEALARVAALTDTDARVQARIAEIQGYAQATQVPRPAVARLAKLAIVLDDWMRSNDCVGAAVQCWSSLQDNLGIFPCTAMSMLSDRLRPCACEADVVGAVAMYALVLAGGQPSALVDWNNNYGDDPDRGLVFHCSNLPKSILIDGSARIESHAGTAESLGRDNSWGMLYARIQASPCTFLRIRTDDLQGRMAAYVGEGTLTDDPVETFGGYGVIRVPGFQRLLQYICRHGFEHHVAISRAQVADVLYEALTTYLGWDVYYHRE